LVPGALPLAMELRPVGGAPELTGPRGPMVHDGLAQGEEPCEEGSAKEVRVGAGAGLRPAANR